VLLDHEHHSVHSLFNHALDELGSLSLHLLEFQGIALDDCNLLAGHSGAVSLELVNTLVHVLHEFLNSVELGDGNGSAFLGLASSSLGHHVSDIGSVVGFDGRFDGKLGLVLSLSDDHGRGLLVASNSSGLLVHKASDLTLRTSSSSDNSVGHRHDSHSDVDDMGLSFSHGRQSLSLHLLESIEASVDGMEVSSALLGLTSLHSLGHVLSECGDMSLSGFLNSSEHHLAGLNKSGHSFLVSSSHLLVERTLMFSDDSGEVLFGDSLGFLRINLRFLSSLILLLVFLSCLLVELR
jgi:hypothetical protein